MIIEQFSLQSKDRIVEIFLRGKDTILNKSNVRSASKTVNCLRVDLFESFGIVRIDFLVNQHRRNPKSMVREHLEVD